MLGDKKFGEFYATACELANRRKKNPPDRRDWDHLHAHYLLKRDVFLTWDQGIICLSQELKDNFSINVIRPDQYVQGSGLYKQGRRGWRRLREKTNVLFL